MKKLLLTFALLVSTVFMSTLGVRAAQNDAVTRNEVTRAGEETYTKVTSASELVVGRKILIVSNDYNYAMSNTVKNNGRYETSVTKTTSNGKTVITPSSSVATFTLTEGYYSGTYGLLDNYYGYYVGATTNSKISYYSSLGTSSSWKISFSSGKATLKSQGSRSLYLKYYYQGYVFNCYTSDSYQSINIYQANSTETEPETPVDTTVAVTGVSLSKTSVALEVGETTTLTATVKPTNATNQSVSWSSSNTTVATVSNGKITAKAAGSAIVTVKTADGGYTAKATVTVTNPTTPVEPEEPTSGKAAWTIMIYMCGADLESKNKLATSDLKEILSVAGQPNDVNIIIETGGAKSWASTYSISASYLSRYHVSNKSLVLDNRLTKASMGTASTFQSFLEWGLTNYPAEKTGVIMWNHGGAMQGVCFDENYSNDSLLNSEVKQALTGAFASTSRTEKLEFIGYDACLMAVQDIAEFNSQFFNYMIASEETESGYGWDYDTWVDDLYAKKSTTTILKAIVDGFIKDNGGTSSYSNDQTLAYYNLAYMSQYKTAWENLASALASKLTSSNKSSFNTLVKSVKYYGDSYYVYYGIFDVKDFVNKLAANSTFNPGSTYTNAVLTAHSKLVEYSSCGKGAGNSYGLAVFWSVASTCYKSSYYTSSQTNFTNWRSLVSSYGA